MVLNNGNNVTTMLSATRAVAAFCVDERIFLTFLTFLFKEVGEGGGGVGWRNMFYTACKIYIGNSS